MLFGKAVVRRAIEAVFKVSDTANACLTLLFSGSCQLF